MLKITLFMILLFTAAPAFAEAPALAGKNELSLNGNFDLQGPNGDNIRVQLGYGWFLRDDLLVGGNYLWDLIEDIAPGDFRSQQATFFADKLFPGDGPLVPYVGGEIGFRNTKFGGYSESGLVYGARAGMRYFLTESVSIDATLSYLFSSKEVFLVDYEAEKQYIYPSFGINAVF